MRTSEKIAGTPGTAACLSLAEVVSGCPRCPRMYRCYLYAGRWEMRWSEIASQADISIKSRVTDLQKTATIKQHCTKKCHLVMCEISEKKHSTTSRNNQSQNCFCKLAAGPGSAPPPGGTALIPGLYSRAHVGRCPTGGRSPRAARQHRPV